MQIGQAAAASGVTAKMMRHYEAIGLIPSADRKSSNYRDYSRHDVHRLGFIRRARALGFSIEEIRDLLRLWSDTRRSSAHVKALAVGHIAELDAKIEILKRCGRRWAPSPTLATETTGQTAPSSTASRGSSRNWRDQVISSTAHIATTYPACTRE